MRIMFVFTPNLVGLSISLTSMGWCNHVALLVGDDKVYSMELEGLREFSLEEYSANNFYAFGPVLNMDESKAVTYLNSKSTVKYDWKRTILWPFQNLFDGDNEIAKWNCVEMVYYTLLDQQIKLWDGDNISPSSLYNITYNGEK